MKKNAVNCRIFFIISLLCLFWLEQLARPAAAYADYPDMQMNATPNPVGSGARAMGIGGAFISVADDATAASWNPGGLLQLTKPEISLAGSRFSGKINYRVSGINGEGSIEDISPSSNHLNYLSAVIPFVLFRRNMVFSLNYQHLYEFSRDNVYTWTVENKELMIQIPEKSRKQQRGSLNTISPALAIQIIPSFFVGLTANFWPGNTIGNIDSGWENLNIMDSEGMALGRKITTHSEIYERYDLSGFNMHFGFLYRSDYHLLWGGRRRFRLGGVIKTPFEASIRHEQREISYTEYPENPVMNNYAESVYSDDLTLKMPLSYGLGVSFDFSDSLSTSLDLYRTHWERYLIRYPSKKEFSPINKKNEEDAHIKPTTQVRLGTEYLIQNPRRIIPIRAGIFYDPEPASDRSDDFYGASLGTGISYKELFSLDFAYQFRFGKKKDAESMQGEDISARITQHYFYASVIYYVF